MTKINLFMNTLFLLIAIIFSAISECSCTISDKRLCYDPECSVPVSLAKTLIRYSAITPGLLSFDINVNAKVYSKEAGNRTDLWGIEINGKRGYAPKSLLKEYKVLHKDLKYKVPTTPLHSDSGKSNNEEPQPKQETNNLPVSSDAEVQSSNKRVIDELPVNKLNGASPPYEVIDGTVINLDHNEPSVQPSFVTEVVKATAVPKNHETIDIIPGVDATHEKSKTNIFAKEELPQEAVEDKSNLRNQHFTDYVYTKPFLTSSEEVIDSSEIVGVTTDIPALATNFIRTEVNTKAGQTTQVPDITETANSLVQDNTSPGASNGKSDAKDAQSLEKSVSFPDSSVSDSSNLIDAKDKKHTVLNSDLKDIPGTKPQSSDINETTDSLIQINKNPSVSDAELNSGKLQSIPNGKSDVKDTQSLEEIISSADASTASSSNVIHPEDTENTVLSNNTNVPSTKSEFEVAVSEETTESTIIEASVPTTEELRNIINNTIIDDSGKEHTEDSKERISELEPDTQAAKNHSIDEAHIDEEKSLEKDIAKSSTDNGTSIESAESHTEKTDNVVQGQENVLTEKPTDLITNTEKSTEEEIVLNNVENQVSDKLDKTSDSAVAATVSTPNEVHDTLSENVLSTLTEESVQQKKSSDVTVESIPNTSHVTDTDIKIDVGEVAAIDDVPENDTINDAEKVNETTVHINVNKIDDLIYNSVSTEVPTEQSESSHYDKEKSNVQLPEQPLYSSQENLIPDVSSFNEFRNRNLLNVDNSEQHKSDNTERDETEHILEKTFPEYGGDISTEDKVSVENLDGDDTTNTEQATLKSIFHEVQVSSPDTCTADIDCAENENMHYQPFTDAEENSQNDKNAVMNRLNMEHSYWLTLMYLSVTAATILLFSLGYYYIENMRRDGQLIAKINKLEKDLLVATKECTMLNDNLISTKEKLTCIEDESFGSNEMVLSLKADLEASQNLRAELEDQVAMLEKDLESATEAGLELERMLREVLSSNNEVNPLAESVEDLQARLNAQQAENESLINALNLKAEENETLSTNLASMKKKCEELEVELARVTTSLKEETERMDNIERTLTDKVQRLEMQLKEISTEKTALQKELKGKEVELKDLGEVINQLNCNNLDLDKLYDVSRIKAEATALLEERDELRVRLSEVEGAHNLLEEHMKLVKEEISSLSEQCKIAEREKKDAETRLEVLTNFFNEKEAQRQKEEALWLQKQGEVVSTVERIQSMQNEIQNYKQQIEMLKREILDQEREYKGQISALETKAHEQWVIARQIERRLEESKAEAAQLRNRLTLIEKNINDSDPEAKLHRLEANGETATSPPLFIGAESSNSPIMFSGSSGVPPPPPSYMHCSIFPPYLPPPLPSSSGVPPYEVGQRPPPLGGRLSSPPPMPMHAPPSSRYDNASSPPPPMSPHMLPPFNHHRSPPPPFGGDHLHPPPPPPPGSILPPPLGATHSWGEESLPPLRNSGFHPHQREQRVRNHKGSLHSSGESLDKTHHSSKV